MNIYDQHPFQVILDYGHNPAAVKRWVIPTASTSASASWSRETQRPPRRGPARDRADLRGTLLAYVSTRRQPARTRRRRGALILRKALVENGVTEDRIVVIPEEPAALQHALERAPRPGDLVLAFGDVVDRCWKQITEFEPGKEVEA
ncbi:MAG: hypothetical protein R3F34_05980 [Planctomycetota bacterium]